MKRLTNRSFANRAPQLTFECVDLFLSSSVYKATIIIYNNNHNKQIREFDAYNFDRFYYD